MGAQARLLEAVRKGFGGLENGAIRSPVAPERVNRWAHTHQGSGRISRELGIATQVGT